MTRRPKRFSSWIITFIALTPAIATGLNGALRTAGASANDEAAVREVLLKSASSFEENNLSSGYQPNPDIRERKAEGTP